MGKRKLSDQNKIDIVNLYNSGLNYHKISAQFNVTPLAIKSVLIKRNIKLRPWFYRKNYFQEDIFETIDTEDKAYWLGFIFGDGNVYKHSLKIQLSIIDENHLMKFTKFMGGNTKINYTTKKSGLKYCSVSCTSKKIVRDLQLLDIIPNKTYLIQNRSKQIPDNLLHHYYRGYLDADGSIVEYNCKKFGYRNQFNFQFACHQIDYLKELELWLTTKLGIKAGYIHNSNPKSKHVNWKLSVNGRKKFIKMYRLFYKDATIYLNRKYQKATEIYNLIKSLKL